MQVHKVGPSFTNFTPYAVRMEHSGLDEKIVSFCEMLNCIGPVASVYFDANIPECLIPKSLIVKMSTPRSSNHNNLW